MHGGGEGGGVGLGALGGSLPCTEDVEELCMAVLAAAVPLLPSLP